MWWAIGFGGLLWIVLAVTLGVMTLRNGHGWLFFLGIFFPILWIFEAFSSPPQGQAHA
jgi:ABC-type multidrug transport system permease subunit